MDRRHGEMAARTDQVKENPPSHNPNPKTAFRFSYCSPHPLLAPGPRQAALMSLVIAIDDALIVP